MGCITSLIDDANVLRLEKWRRDVLTRGGAAKWVKGKISTLKPAVLPAFFEVHMDLLDFYRKLQWLEVAMAHHKRKS